MTTTTEDQERDNLIKALADSDKLIKQLMPGIAHIALQDYGFLNEVLMANRRLLDQYKV